MAIHRVPKVPYAQIANCALRDKALSFRARGILALVLSNSGEWSAPREWIEEQSDKEGREAIQSALNELSDLGYRVIHKEQDSAGQWSTWVEWFHQPTERPENRLPVEPAAIQKTIKNTIKRNGYVDGLLTLQGGLHE